MKQGINVASTHNAMYRVFIKTTTAPSPWLTASLPMADSDCAAFKVNIQGSLVKFVLDVLPTDTIISVKHKICAVVSDAQPAGLKLIYSGRILKDAQTVTESGIESGHTIHLVKSQPAGDKKKDTAAADAAPSPAPLSATPQQMALMRRLLDAHGHINPASFDSASLDAASVDQDRRVDMVRSIMMEIRNNPQMVHEVLGATDSHNLSLPPEALQIISNPELLQPIIRAAMANSGLFSMAQDQQQQQQQQQQQPVQDPEVRFADQLQQLHDMGFWDKQSNIRALTIAHGSVSQAVEYLIAHPPQ